jgi:hypothetical protein
MGGRVIVRRDVAGSGWSSGDEEDEVVAGADHGVMLCGVTPEPGERRRVRYGLRSAPVQLAQQFLAALAHSWDDRLDDLQHYLTAQ